MPYVEVNTVIKAPRQALFPIIKDMEKYPEFMPDVVSVKVLEREGNTTLTEWVTNVDGRVIRWKERDIIDDARCHIAYRQTEGDLKKFEGEWILEEVPEGTKVTLTVDFEFGIPMVAGLLNPILKKKVKDNSDNMLRAIKERMERAPQ